mgnify:CR=1 FL=1
MGCTTLGDASMSRLWYVQELDGMVHHPCYPQGCLGSYDVMHFGAWSDVSAYAVSTNKEWRFLMLVGGPKHWDHYVVIFQESAPH